MSVALNLEKIIASKGSPKVPLKKTAIGTDYAPEGNASFLIFSEINNLFKQLRENITEQGFIYLPDETKTQEMMLKNKFDNFEIYKGTKIFVYLASTAIVDAAAEFYAQIMLNCPSRKIMLDIVSRDFDTALARFEDFKLRFSPMENERYLMYEN